MSSSLRLPVVVDVPNPCEVDWEDMVGDDRGRHCGLCGKTVRNLSALDGDEIAEVLARGDCVSFLYREDASIVTSESGSKRATAIGARATAVVLAATMALTLGCDVKRTGGEPVPVGSAVANVAGEAVPASGGVTGVGSQSGAMANSVSASGVAATEPIAGAGSSPSAKPSANCAPSAKAVTGKVAPSGRPRRTAGKPMRPSELE